MSTTTTGPNTPTVAHGLPGPAVAPHRAATQLQEAQFEALRAALETSRRERRALLQSLTAEDLHEMENDPAAAAQVTAARRIVKETDEALTRMDDGSFGFCVHCQEPIPWPRLEFLPHARGCVPCTQRTDARR